VGGRVTVLQESEVFWLSTVPADGRPHVTTLLAGWIDDELHFVTSDGEQKMRNLDGNPHCVLTTGHERGRIGTRRRGQGHSGASDR